MKDKNLFSNNELALLMDRKERRYLVTLESGKTFHSHLGQLPHNDLIDKTVGGWYKTDRGHVLLAIRPSLADYVVEMPRGPQIIYPKDLGTIITLADIFPGATVIEAGLGSGSLTAALLRAVGNTGQIISYDVNESTIDKALNNIQRVVPDTSNLTIKIGDIYEEISETQVDRIVLDVPEPWQAVKSVGDSLVMGGRFLSFLPTVLQVHELSGQLREDGRFQMISTIETLLRSWHVSERSVRPDHRMVAHSGFLTTAVRCEQKSLRPSPELPDEEIKP
ncbi:MAG: tRNA (adenine-N1)-methyltransferase [Chloroflexota bacterium]|nr:tRNA (adenine-N1)-methyltransferase [Chloroflexota bacterium]